jgi:integrase
MTRARTPTFPEIAERYLAERVVTPTHAANVRRIAARVKLITANEVNKFLRLRLQERKSTTVKAERGVLLTLAKWAYERDYLDKPIKGVLKIKARREPTRAWTVAELRAVIDATRQWDSRTTRRGTSIGVFLRGWILLGYECGSRHGDLWQMRVENLNGDAVQWTQSKTGDAITRLLSRSCLEAIRELAAQSPDGRILGWVVKKRQAARLMRQLLDSVGVGGSSKWLRRSGATHIEIREPGKAKLHLGHRTPGLAETNYLDWSQIRANTPRAPELID